MEVYLIRHAVAEVRDPLQWPDDTKRPLTPEGADRFRRAAAGLASLVPEVGIVLSSPWRRAWETAQILHEVAGWPKPEKCEALEGHRSPRGLPSILRQHVQAESVALVGHEPQLHTLASYLLTGDSARLLVEFKKGGAAAFRLDNAIRPGTATLLWSHPPRVLRRLT